MPFREAPPDALPGVTFEAIADAHVEAPPAPRILLAEDDDEMRLFLGEALEEAGYEVSETEDGASALATLRASARATAPSGDVSAMPDALVLDVRMPGSSGVDVLAELRAAGWGMPVILMSGFGDDDLRASALRLGAAAMLQKPFDFEELATALSAVLGASAPGGMTAPASAPGSSR